MPLEAQRTKRNYFSVECRKRLLWRMGWRWQWCHGSWTGAKDAVGRGGPGAGADHRDPTRRVLVPSRLQPCRGISFQKVGT